MRMMPLGTAVKSFRVAAKLAGRKAPPVKSLTVGKTSLPLMYTGRLALNHTPNCLRSSFETMPFAAWFAEGTDGTPGREGSPKPFSPAASIKSAAVAAAMIRRYGDLIWALRGRRAQPPLQAFLFRAGEADAVVCRELVMRHVFPLVLRIGVEGYEQSHRLVGRIERTVSESLLVRELFTRLERVNR